MIGTKKQIINWILEQPDDKKLEIKLYHPKRGLKANAYYWELINQLADVLRMSKEELHLFLLKQYGQSQIVSVLADIDVTPYFKYYSEAGKSVLNGKTFKHYKVYKGSSEMDSREMSVLINGLVDECRNQGIETRPEAEIKSMLEAWK